MPVHPRTSSFVILETSMTHKLRAAPRASPAALINTSSTKKAAVANNTRADSEAQAGDSAIHFAQAARI